MRRVKWLVVLMSVAIAMVGCSDDDTSPDEGQTGVTTDDGKGDAVGGETMCAAVRGNGQLIPAHFGALARLVEHYGPLHAISGGSSGSITSYLVSSIRANPLLDRCGDKACTPQERWNREALLLKSFQGYLEFLANSEDALAVRALAPIAAKIQEEGIESLLETDPEGARDALLTILESDAFITLINPEVIQLVSESANPEYHIQDLLAAIQGFGAFDATDPMILLRPGVLDFTELADRISMAASFYAGYGPFDEAAVGRFLDACADQSRGQAWSSIREMEAPGASCGNHFFGALAEYREAFEADPSESRGDDLVGTFMPALISTSVLTGDAVTAWRQARTQYTSAEEAELAIDFSDIRFGYFGSSEATARLAETNKRADLKSRMAISLGSVTWREALSYSPAEPGLARALELPDGKVSAGGWSDLHPVLVLKDIGCDKVVYITRTDGAANFAIGVAGLLGMGEQEQRELYDLDNPESSFSQSLRAADAVWCTNWNNIDALDVDAVTRDAYNAPLQTTDEYFRGDAAYANVVADTGLVGCSVE